MKEKTEKSEAMTGKEFYRLLEIDYNKIVNERKEIVRSNIDYYLSELVKISQVQ